MIFHKFLWNCGRIGAAIIMEIMPYSEGYTTLNLERKGSKGSTLRPIWQKTRQVVETCRVFAECTLVERLS
jgi:hypothetical protein